MPAAMIPLAVAALTTVDFRSIATRIEEIALEFQAIDWSLPMSEGGCMSTVAPYPYGMSPDSDAGICKTDSDCQVNGDTSATCFHPAGSQNSYCKCSSKCRQSVIQKGSPPYSMPCADVGYDSRYQSNPDGKAMCGPVVASDTCTGHLYDSMVIPDHHFNLCDDCGYDWNQQEMQHYVTSIVQFLRNQSKLLPAPAPSGTPSPLTDWVKPILKANISQVASTVEGITSSWLRVHFSSDDREPPYVGRELNQARQYVIMVNKIAARVAQNTW